MEIFFTPVISVPNTTTLPLNTTPNTTPDAPNAPTPGLNNDPMSIETNATELKSPKKENEDDPLTNNKKPTRVSNVWVHFTKVKGGSCSNPRCKCNYCGADYACHTTRVGTSSLWGHLRKCKKYPKNMADKKQKVLNFMRGTDGGENLLATTFNKVRCRNALAKFVVKDEQAFNVVESEGFKDLINELQPRFIVPSRMTVTRDIYNLFCNERSKLMKELTAVGQKVCLTTDYWTSRTQMSYLCLTAHYIDSEWQLQSRIINFCQIPNHKGETIGKIIEACLLDWGIEKVFTITLDNASANDVAVGFIKRRVNAWRGSVLGGEHLNVRCGAHVMNLIVNDGLTKLHDSIAAIRNSVRYIRASPARLQKFRACAEKEKIDYKGGLVLDVATRWNSTYMMLEVALKFEKAFIRYEEEDDKFLSYFLEKENGKKRIGPPISNDWQSASVFVQFLSTFYEVTLKFSGTLHVTSNNFYHEICEVHTLLAELADADHPLLSVMAASMKGKYDKYWGSTDNINPLLFLAVVLDPRYKMGYLKYCFESVYDAETVAMIVIKVESILHQLYACYNVGADGVCTKDATTDSPPMTTIGKEKRNRRLLETYMQQQHMGITEKKNDIDVYLAEEPVNPMVDKFDILLWWKDNASKYKTLSMIARDILAIPVSSVASESAFSTSGRILDPFRSSLSPKMLEALVCTQSWLKGNRGGIKSSNYLDETHSYEFLEREEDNKGKMNDSGASKDKSKTKVIHVIDD